MVEITRKYKELRSSEHYSTFVLSSDDYNITISRISNNVEVKKLMDKYRNLYKGTSEETLSEYEFQILWIGVSSELNKIGPKHKMFADDVINAYARGDL